MTIHYRTTPTEKRTYLVMENGGGILVEVCTLCNWKAEGFFWGIGKHNHHEFTFGHQCKYSIKPSFWFNIDYVTTEMYTPGSVEWYRSGQAKYTIVFYPDENGRVVSIQC